MDVTPFNTIESTAEFLHLLHEEIQRTETEIQTLLNTDTQARRVEALRLVLLKLQQLRGHTDSSLRLVHDLATLRSLLLR